MWQWQNCLLLVNSSESFNPARFRKESPWYTRVKISSSANRILTGLRIPNPNLYLSLEPKNILLCIQLVQSMLVTALPAGVMGVFTPFPQLNLVLCVELSSLFVLEMTFLFYLAFIVGR